MKKYAFSIFTRGFIAISGFLVFLVSASLFGADGRGIISYGTSLFAFFGLLFSFNFGRSFISETVMNEDLKKELLSDHLFLNFISIIITCITALIFWSLSRSAQQILEFKIVLAMIMTSVFYVWSINSNSIFAAFQATHIQERFITIFRVILCLVLLIFYIFKIHDLAIFMLSYSLILSIGAASEIFYLIKKYELVIKVPKISSILPNVKKSLWPHLDYLAFNLFPIILILITGKFLAKSEIGKINFALQFISVIYLLSTVANIRVSSYVSVVGFRAKQEKIKKLFSLTMLFSIVASLCTYLVLKYIINGQRFASFEGTAELFLVLIIAIPGYVFYQFLNPIFLEFKLIKKSAIFNSIALALCILISYMLVSSGDSKHAVTVYSLFYAIVFFNQYYLLKSTSFLRENTQVFV